LQDKSDSSHFNVPERHPSKQFLNYDPWDPGTAPESILIWYVLY